ncbi:unnamed protein product [Orchesella dallaii]|uniref:Alpha N-terminal protein methyltransferase 1 n=1 Tax=Orchesella dallaii TaxID=48710 RepID=A0ABP1S6E3_9HEXA
MASEKATNGIATQEQPTSSTTGAETPKSILSKEEVMKQAINSLVQGKRHLVVKDFQSAIDSLGESCRLLSESGAHITCFENAEAHFFYGKALLEQSRLEMGVLETPDLGKSEDNSEDESEDEDKSEEEDEDSEEAEAAADVLKLDGEAESSEATANGTSDEAKSKPASTPQESAVTSTDEAKQNDVQEQEVDLNTPSPTVDQVVDNEVPSTSSGLIADAMAEKAAEDELNNLELAWEVLEVAKIGYIGLLTEISGGKPVIPPIVEKTEEELKKLKEKEKLIKKRLADTHCSLGEVATESENYNQAIDEFKTGLDILADIEGSDSREIAQYYFQMGLAFSFDKKYPEAIGSFKKSVEIIETRISILKNKIENKQTAKDLGIELEDPSKTEADEVQELTALLPELQEKITDTIDAEKESQAMEEEEQKEQEIIQRNSPVKNPNPPAANDISHLVKKKKKAEDGPADERPVKKLCTEVAAAAPAIAVDAEMKDESKKSAVEKGSATNGHPIAIDAMESDHSNDSKVDPSNSKFYDEGAEYWAKIEPTVNGMLGGLGYLNNGDIKDSERFLKGMMKARKSLGTSYALDCGAGIGRITKNLLSRFFDKVDLVDQDPKFVDEAKTFLSNNAKVGELYCSGLQEFSPQAGKYDVIWMQWVLSHVTDDDLLSLLKRCSVALKPGGIIVIKENCTKGEIEDRDEDDSSITRPFKGFMNVFAKSGIKVLKYVKQKNFPTELYPVWIFALDPHPELA